MASKETDICTAIISAITTGVPSVQKVTFDRVFTATTDIREDELPMVQIWDVGQTITHIRGRKQADWALVLEIIIRSTDAGEVDQRSLWDLRRDIELALWNKPNLGVPGVNHLIYTGNFTDLHLDGPNYIGRMEFIVQFLDSLVGDC